MLQCIDMALHGFVCFAMLYFDVHINYVIIFVYISIYSYTHYIYIYSMYLYMVLCCL